MELSLQEPTAMQLLADVHDTELSVLNTAGPGFSKAGSKFHVFPFHSSETAKPDTSPTARHELADVQETPLNSVLLDENAGFVGWIVQLAPFQRSASACTGCGNDAEVPTAVHALAAVHDTALRSPVAPGGLGVGVIDQLGPGDPGGLPTTVAAPAVGASASTASTARTPPSPARRSWANRGGRVIV